MLKFSVADSHPQQFTTMKSHSIKSLFLTFILLFFAFCTSSNRLVFQTGSNDLVPINILGSSPVEEKSTLLSHGLVRLESDRSVDFSIRSLTSKSASKSPSYSGKTRLSPEQETHDLIFFAIKESELETRFTFSIENISGIGKQKISFPFSSNRLKSFELDLYHNRIELSYSFDGNQDEFIRVCNTERWIRVDLYLSVYDTEDISKE